MPVAATYPGVYIEEIPSGVRTITGVATSITAFIGRALRGPTDEPVTINSNADFERIFGGLWTESALGFAVRDFYLNGGSQAIIVRLYHPKFATTEDRDKAIAAATAVATATDGADPAAAAAAAVAAAALFTGLEKTAADVVANAATQAAAVAGATVASVKAAADAAVPLATPINKATLDVNGLKLEAKYEGTWGNALRARIDHDVVGPDAANLFNLSVRDGSTGQIEVLRNVSVLPGHVRQVDKVLLNESQLVQMTGVLPASKPAAHPDLAAGETDIWADNATPTNAKVAASAMASDGGNLDNNDFTGSGKENAKTGLYALKKADLFNILCIPPYLATGNIDTALVGTAASYCEQRRAVLLVDPPATWTDKDKAKSRSVGHWHLEQKLSVIFSTAKTAQPLTREPNRRVRSLRRGGWNFFPYRYSTRGLESAGGPRSHVSGCAAT